MNPLAEFSSWVGVALVTLLPIVNPVSTAVLLLSISSHLSQAERNRQITRACIYMTVILVTFLLAGHFIMVAFGISIPGIRIAGGMVIGFLGFRMLFPDEGHEIARIAGKVRFAAAVMEFLVRHLPPGAAPLERSLPSAACEVARPG